MIVSKEGNTIIIPGVSVSGVPEAPIDGEQYVRKDGEWQVGVPVHDYVQSFVDGDLIANKITIVHNLNVRYPSSIVLWDDVNMMQQPVCVASIDANTVEVEVSGTITGTWNVSIN